MPSDRLRASLLGWLLKVLAYGGSVLSASVLLWLFFRRDRQGKEGDDWYEIKPREDGEEPKDGVPDTAEEKIPLTDDDGRKIPTDGPIGEPPDGDVKKPAEGDAGFPSNGKIPKQTTGSQTDLTLPTSDDADTEEDRPLLQAAGDKRPKQSDETQTDFDDLDPSLSPSPLKDFKFVDDYSPKDESGLPGSRPTEPRPQSSDFYRVREGPAKYRPASYLIAVGAKDEDAEGPKEGQQPDQGDAVDGRVPSDEAGNGQTSPSRTGGAVPSVQSDDSGVQLDDAGNLHPPGTTLRTITRETYEYRVSGVKRAAWFKGEAPPANGEGEAGKPLIDKTGEGVGDASGDEGRPSPRKQTDGTQTDFDAVEPVSRSDESLLKSSDKVPSDPEKVHQYQGLAQKLTRAYLESEGRQQNDDAQGLSTSDESWYTPETEFYPSSGGEQGLPFYDASFTSPTKQPKRSSSSGEASLLDDDVSGGGRPGPEKGLSDKGKRKDQQADQAPSDGTRQPAGRHIPHDKGPAQKSTGGSQTDLNELELSRVAWGIKVDDDERRDGRSDDETPDKMTSGQDIPSAKDDALKKDEGGPAANENEQTKGRPDQYRVIKVETSVKREYSGQDDIEGTEHQEPDQPLTAEIRHPGVHDKGEPGKALEGDGVDEYGRPLAGTNVRLLKQTTTVRVERKVHPLLLTQSTVQTDFDDKELEDYLGLRHGALKLTGPEDDGSKQGGEVGERGLPATRTRDGDSRDIRDQSASREDRSGLDDVGGLSKHRPAGDVDQRFYTEGRPDLQDRGRIRPSADEHLLPTSVKVTHYGGPVPEEEGRDTDRAGGQLSQRLQRGMGADQGVDQYGKPIVDESVSKEGKLKQDARPDRDGLIDKDSSDVSVDQYGRPITGYVKIDQRKYAQGEPSMYEKKGPRKPEDALSSPMGKDDFWREHMEQPTGPFNSEHDVRQASGVITGRGLKQLAFDLHGRPIDELHPDYGPSDRNSKACQTGVSVTRLLRVYDYKVYGRPMGTEFQIDDSRIEGTPRKQGATSVEADKPDVEGASGKSTQSITSKEPSKEPGGADEVHPSKRPSILDELDSMMAKANAALSSAERRLSELQTDDQEPSTDASAQRQHTRDDEGGVFYERKTGGAAGKDDAVPTRSTTKEKTVSGKQVGPLSEFAQGKEVRRYGEADSKDGARDLANADLASPIAGDIATDREPYTPSSPADVASSGAGESETDDSMIGTPPDAAGKDQEYRKSDYNDRTPTSPLSSTNVVGKQISSRGGMDAGPPYGSKHEYSAISPREESPKAKRTPSPGVVQEFDASLTASGDRTTERSDHEVIRGEEPGEDEPLLEKKLSPTETDQVDAAATGASPLAGSPVDEAARKAAEEIDDGARKAIEEAAKYKAEEEAARVADKVAAEAEAARKAADESAKKTAEEAASGKAVDEVSKRKGDDGMVKVAAKQAEKETAGKAAEETDKKKAEEDAARKSVEEAAKRKAEEEATSKAARQAEEEATRRAAEEAAKRKAEEDAARPKAGEEAAMGPTKTMEDEAVRRDAEEAAKRGAKEDAAKNATDEAARKAAEEAAKKKAEEDVAQKDADEAIRRRAAEEAATEAAKQAEEATRLAAEEAAKRKAEDEAARLAALKAAEEESARKAAEEAARKKADEDAAKKAAEEAAKRKADEAIAAAKRAEDEAAKRAAEEAAKKKSEEDAARKAAEEAAKRKAEEEAAIAAAKKAEDEAAEEAAKKKAVEDAARRAAEEAAKRKANEEAAIAAAKKAEEEVAQEAAKKEAADDAARRAAEEAAKRKADEEAAIAAAKKAEEEAAKRSAEEAAKRAAEEDAARKAAEEAAKRKADEEAAIAAAKKAEEEADKRSAEEAAKRAAEEDAARKAAEEAAKRKADEEAARLAALKAAEEEAARKTAEEAAKKKAEEEAARRAAEEAAKRKAEEEAARLAALKAAEDEAARKAAEEAAKRKAEEDAARRAAEEAAKRKADEEAARLAAEEAAKKKAEEDAARKAAEEAAKRKAEEEAARLAAEEAAKKKAEEDAAKKAAEEAAKRKAEEEAAIAAAKKAEDEAAKRAAEEAAKKKAEEDAAKKAAEEAAKRKAEEEAAIAAAKRAEEEATKRAAEEAAKKKAEEEEAVRLAALKAAEEEAARKAAEEAAKKKAEEDAARRAAEDAAKMKAEEEETARLAALKAAEEEAARKAAEEAAKKKAEEDAARRAAEEAAKRKADEEAARLAALKAAKEEAARKAAEEAAKRKAEENDARKAAEEAAKRKAEEETAIASAKRAEEEAARKSAEEAAKRKSEEDASKKAAEELNKEAESKSKARTDDELSRKSANEDNQGREPGAKIAADEATPEEAAQKGAADEVAVKARAEEQEAAEKRAAEEEKSARLAAAEAAKKEEEEATKKKAAEELAAKIAAEDAAKKAVEAEPPKLTGKAAKKAAKEAAKKKEAEEKAAKKAAEEAKKKKEAEEKAAKKAAEEEAKKKAAEEKAAKKAAEAAAKKAAQEASKKNSDKELAAKKAEEDAARKASEESARKAAEDLAARKAAEEQKKADEEAKKAAEEAARKAEEEAARKAAEEAAKKKAEEEAAKKSADEAAAKKRAEEEEAAKRAAEEAAKKKAEEEAARRAEEEAAKQAEEAAKKAAEPSAKKALEELVAKKTAEEKAAEANGVTDDAAPQNPLQAEEKELKSFYREAGNNVQPIPWMEDFKVDLDDVNMDLSIENQPRIRTPDAGKTIRIDEIFDPLTNIRGKKGEPPKRILIRGQPGIGKSTLCRKLAYDWSNPENETGTIKKFKYTFLIEGRHLGGDLKNAMAEQLLSQGFNDSPENLWKFVEDNQSDVLFIVDGYDEIDTSVKSDVGDLISKKILPQSTLVITSRPESTKEISRSVDKQLKVEGFNQEKSADFVNKHFHVTSPNTEHAPDVTENLVAALRRDKNLQQLAAYPLCNAYLCALWEDTDGDIPSTKSSLYDRLKIVVTRRYCLKQGVPLPAKPSDVPAQFRSYYRALGELAYNGVTNNRVLFDKPLVLHKVRDPRVLQMGLLLEEHSIARTKRHEYYRFPHKAFQEFFAAQYLSEMSERLRSPTYPKLVKDRVWRDIVLFLPGALKQQPRDLIPLFKALSEYNTTRKSTYSDVGQYRLSLDTLFEAELQDMYSTIVAPSLPSLLTESHPIIEGVSSPTLQGLACVLKQNNIDVKEFRFGVWTEKYDQNCDTLTEALNENQTVGKLVIAACNENDVVESVKDILSRLAERNNTVKSLQIIDYSYKGPLKYDERIEMLRKVCTVEEIKIDSAARVWYPGLPPNPSEAHHTIRSTPMTPMSTD